MLTHVTYCVPLLIMFSWTLATAEEVESSRTYGKAYVARIEAGGYPPVCVVEHIAGPSVTTKVTAMRDPKRPSILVFCTSLSPDTCRVINALDASTSFAGIPLFVTITEEKGIAGSISASFNIEKYYSHEETKRLVESHQATVADAGYTNATVGVAVNRFWRGAIGYKSNDGVIVAYVRGTVQAVEVFRTESANSADVNAMLSRFGICHREYREEKM